MRAGGSEKCAAYVSDRTAWWASDSCRQWVHDDHDPSTENWRPRPGQRNSQFLWAVHGLYPIWLCRNPNDVGRDQWPKCWRPSRSMPGRCTCAADVELQVMYKVNEKSLAKGWGRGWWVWLTVLPAAVVGIAKVTYADFAICQSDSYNRLIAVIWSSHTSRVLIARFVW